MKSRFLAVGTVLAVLVNFYLYRSIATTGIVLFFLLTSFLFAFGYGLTKRKELLLILTSVILLGSLAIYRAALLPQLLLLGGMFTSFLVFWYLNVIQSNFLRSLSEFFLVPFSLAGSYLSAGIESIGTVFHFFNYSHKDTPNPVKEWLPSIILGFMAGIPIVGVLLLLFSSADPIFNKTLQNIFSSFTVNELGVRLLISFAIFLLTLPVAFMKIKQDFVSPANAIIPISAIKPITVIMSMVAITIGLFIIIQWPYVFAHVDQEQSLTKFGVATYSEYVKRGFGEFLITAAFIYSVVWIGLLAHRHTFKKRNSVLFLIQTGVIILFSIFLLSVGRRIFLYWEFHGLTVIRLYGSLFLLWIGFLTTTLYLRHFFQWKWIQIEVIGTFLLLTTIGLVNAEHFIVTHHPPTVNDTVDTVYLTRLSADGYDGWKQAYEQSTLVIRDLTTKKGTLNEEDRRKAAYAGITLGLLNRNYYQLTEKYATENEKRTFAEKIIKELDTDIQQTTTLFSESMNTLQQKGDEATVAAERYMHAEGTSKSYTINGQLISLQSLATESSILANQSSDSSLFARLAPRIPNTLGEYNTALCGQFYYRNVEQSKFSQSSACIPSFYGLRQKEKHVHALDRLFTWNWQASHIYHRLSTEIPLDNLVQTQKEYTAVWKRIIEQPPNERAYQQDISYEAPFVAPLW